MRSRSAAVLGATSVLVLLVGVGGALATNHNENEILLEPEFGPPGSVVAVEVRGEILDAYPFATHTFSLLFFDQNPVECEKHSQLINQTKWLTCSFSVPGDAPEGLYSVGLGIQDANDVWVHFGPDTAFFVMTPSTTTTQTPLPPPPAKTTTTVSSASTTSVTATPTTNGPPETTVSAEVSTTSSSTSMGLSISDVIAAIDEAENEKADEGPTWLLVVFLVAALSIALTVIVMQNLNRKRKSQEERT